MSKNTTVKDSKCFDLKSSSALLFKENREFTLCDKQPK